jgi:hypothetical protein
VLVGALFVSGNLLRERVETMSGDLPQYRQEVQQQVQSHPELDLATTLLDIRKRRSDWSPMLAGLADHCGRDMVLDEIEATTSNDKDRAMLVISGAMNREDTSLEEVSAFMASLRDDPRFNHDFDEIELGNIRGGGSGDFQVVCVEKEGQE